jgi:uncharacterized YccA/Bax inhibitor family protein
MKSSLKTSPGCVGAIFRLFEFGIAIMFLLNDSQLAEPRTHRHRQTGNKRAIAR